MVIGTAWHICMCFILKKDHKDIPQKRAATPGSSNTAKKPNLTVNEDLKVAMLACSSEADVQALIEQFQEKE